MKKSRKITLIYEASFKFEKPIIDHIIKMLKNIGLTNKKDFYLQNELAIQITTDYKNVNTITKNVSKIIKENKEGLKCS